MRRKKKPRSQAGYTLHNKVRLIHGGKDYFSTLLQLIDHARSTIHLQTYIFENDETGRLVSDALLRAAARKVQVYILLDGYASQELPRQLLQNWKEAGIFFRWFWPLFKSRKFYLGRRLHHKVVVADAACGMAGGVNISNRYNDIGGIKAWLDRALFVEGEAALRLHIICRDMWIKAYWKKNPHKKYIFNWLPGFVPQEECLVRVRRNDWVQAKSQISRSYLEMFGHARSRIIVLSSYFLPGSILRARIAAAARRGVQIQVIVGSVSDVRISRLAEQYMYRWLFRNKIEVYEYQDTVLHGKMAVYDNSWTTIGSYNVNKISAYASVELNMDVRNERFARGVTEELEGIMREHCVRMTPESFARKSSTWKRLMQWLAFTTIRILFWLFTFYFRQEKGTGKAAANPKNKTAA